MSKYVKHLSENGTAYVLLDCPNLREEQKAIEVIQHCSAQLLGHPANSLRVVFDLTNTIFTRRTLAAVDEFNRAIGRSVLRSAIVGADGLMTIAIRTIARQSPKPVKMFDDHATAVAWIVSDED